MATNNQGVISTAQSAELHSAFHAEKQAILDALNSPQPQLSDISKSITLLRLLVDSFGEALPKYDRGRYANQLAELEAKVSEQRKKEKPRSRFAFSKPKSSPISVSKLQPSSAASADSGETVEPEAVPSTTSNTHEISSLSRTFVRPSLPPGTGPYTLSLSSMSECVIDLRPGPSLTLTETVPTLTTLHSKDLRRCVLIAPVLPGSAMMSDMIECLVIVGCQQFRIHSSTKTSILLNVASLPVIEDCKEMKFGPYPPNLLSTSLDYVSKHAQVQDFDWVRGGPSPHWTLLQDKEIQNILAGGILAERDGLSNDQMLLDEWINRI